MVGGRCGSLLPSTDFICMYYLSQIVKPLPRMPVPYSLDVFLVGLQPDLYMIHQLDDPRMAWRPSIQVIGRRGIHPSNE